jgi:psiF repeat
MFGAAFSLASKAVLASLFGLMVAGLTLGAAAREYTPAQQRLRACHAQADERKLDGAARTKFINGCVDGIVRAPTLTPREQRHEACNARARGLEGAARRGYMTQCEKPPADARASNAAAQERECARRAHGRRLGGDERRAYVKGCLDAAAAGG